MKQLCFYSMLANPLEQGDHPGVAAHLCHGLHLVDANVHGGLASIQDHLVCRHNPRHQVEHLIITCQSLLNHLSNRCHKGRVGFNFYDEANWNGINC